MLGQQMRFQQPPQADKGDGWIILFTLSIFPFIGVAVAIFGWLGFLQI